MYCSAICFTTVTIEGSGAADIRGILLQAREVNTDTALGSFIDLDSNNDFKGIDCGGMFIFLVQFKFNFFYPTPLLINHPVL